MTAPGTVGTAPDVGASTSLTILYDERCRFCLRCRDWLATQPCLVEVELLGAGSTVARERYGAVPWLGSELVVVDERGQVWVGPAAFLMCLWATARYRSWSYLLSRPGYSHHAERFFRHVSKRRGAWGEWLGRKDDEDCASCEDLGLAEKRP
jgi:predicted DCC family thiol-disulfide oxidoreductase YuxK